MPTMRRTKRGAGRQKGDSGPQYRAVRVVLDEEEIELLEKGSRNSIRSRARYAGVLLSNAIRADWAYSDTRGQEVKAVTSARDFFADLYHLQRSALEEIERAGNAAKNAASEAAQRCQQWLDAEKARRDTRAAGAKVVGGKFGRSA